MGSLPKPQTKLCQPPQTPNNQETLPLLRETETLSSLPKPQTKLCQLPQTLNNQETLPLSRETLTPTQSILSNFHQLIPQLFKRLPLEISPLKTTKLSTPPLSKPNLPKSLPTVLTDLEVN